MRSRSRSRSSVSEMSRSARALPLAQPARSTISWTIAVTSRSTQMGSATLPTCHAALAVVRLRALMVGSIEKFEALSAACPYTVQ